MATDESGLDRLLPRHELPSALTIRWNTLPRRGILRRGSDESTDGLIRDLSLQGALIEVPNPTAVEVGDRIGIQLGERSGVVEVRHTTATESGDGVLFGVTFVEADELEDQLHIVIKHLRGDHGQLSEVWKRAT